MTIVRQRGDGDCGIAALSMLASMAYEDVYVVIAQIDPHAHGKGSLNNRDLVTAAKRLGLNLQPTRRYDLDADDGILRVRWGGPRGKKNPGGHFVAVRSGLLLCPTDAAVYDWRDYLAMYGGRACTLLRRAD